jgi:hypothetical protein
MDALAPETRLSEARRAPFEEWVGIWVQDPSRENASVKVHHLTGQDLDRTSPDPVEGLLAESDRWAR